MAAPRRWLGTLLEMVSGDGGAAKPVALPLTKALLERSDDSTSNAIIQAFDQDAMFSTFSQQEMDGILGRDPEDARGGFQDRVLRVRSDVWRGKCGIW